MFFYYHNKNHSILDKIVVYSMIFMLLIPLNTIQAQQLFQREKHNKERFQTNKKQVVFEKKIVVISRHKNSPKKNNDIIMGEDEKSHESVLKQTQYISKNVSNTVQIDKKSNVSVPREQVPAALTNYPFVASSDKTDDKDEKSVQSDLQEFHVITNENSHSFSDVTSDKKSSDTDQFYIFEKFSEKNPKVKNVKILTPQKDKQSQKSVIIKKYFVPVNKNQYVESSDAIDVNSKKAVVLDQGNKKIKSYLFTEKNSCKRDKTSAEPDPSYSFSTGNNNLTRQTGIDSVDVVVEEDSSSAKPVIPVECQVNKDIFVDTNNVNTIDEDFMKSADPVMDTSTKKSNSIFEASAIHADKTASEPNLNFVYQQGTRLSKQLMPNLRPYNPRNWDDIVVVSNNEGTNSDTVIYSDETSYIDYAYINDGTNDINQRFYIELYINGTRIRRAYKESLQSGYYGYNEDVEYTFTTPGTYTIQFVCDADNDIAESNEYDNEHEGSINVSSNALPNITPYKPSSWEDKIVVSNKEGTNSNTVLYSGETSYIDYAYINNGENDINQRFYIELYINGTRIRRAYKESLQKGYYGYNEDVEYTFSAPGTYTLKFVCDADKNIAESNEYDNEHEEDIIVSTNALPNLTPHKPSSWEDKIVVSNIEGTNSNTVLYSGETSYIDYAYINNGEIDINQKFYIELYINGTRIRRAYKESLQKGYYGYNEDVEYTFSTSGTYTLKLVCDADKIISESNEYDNEHEGYAAVSSNALPNLTPYKPSSWEDKIIVSNIEGTNSNNTIYNEETAYIDYAYLNNGDTDINQKFYLELYINDERVRRAYNEDLQQNYYGYHEDFEHIFSEPGTYSIKLICDADNNVDELDETDNTFTRNKLVLSPQKPNVAPHQPKGWDNIIIVSNKMGTNTQDTIYAGEKAYIDYAYINNGLADIKERFYVTFYVDGSQVRRSYMDDLEQGYYGYKEDLEYTFSESGIYTLKLITDVDDNIIESDETDNEYQIDIESISFSKANLTPYQPDDWDDKIVVSNKKDTTNSDTLYVGEKAYIDYAYKNDSTTDIEETFYVELYINGSRVRKAYMQGLKQKYYGYKKDFEHTFSQAGTYTIKLVCDTDNNVNESNENDNTYQRSISTTSVGKPNLTPYKPSDWEDKIVISNKAGTFNDSTIYAGQTAYIDYSYINNGAADIIGKFYLEFYVNNERVRRASNSDLLQEYYGFAEDFEYVFENSGVYTLKLVCDADNDISEINEMDNEYEKDNINVVSYDKPNITPYQPKNWDDLIVVSGIQNTNTDSQVFAGETAYIDYAYINNGEIDIPEKFYMELYINENRVRRAYMSGLDKGHYGYKQDFEYSFTKAGENIIKIICDVDNVVIESNENDNQYQREKTIKSEGTADIRIEPTRLSFDNTNSGARTKKHIDTLQNNDVLLSHGVIHSEQTRSLPLDFDSRKHLLMQFSHIPTAKEKLELEANGIQLLKYVPNNTYWVSIDPDNYNSSKEKQTNTGVKVKWAHTPESVYKMSQEILKKEFPRNARMKDGTVVIYVMIFKDVTQAEIVKAIKELGESKIQILNWISDKTISVRTEIKHIEKIASLDEVEWIEPAEPPDIPFNETAAKRIYADVVRKAPLNLDGQGVTVGVWDGGAVYMHDDFGNRLTVMDNPPNVSSHATHVAGTIGGGGLNDITAMGMSPAVRIRSYDWENDEMEMGKAIKNGIFISNHSYGLIAGWEKNDYGVWENEYGSTNFGKYSYSSQEWDEIIYNTGLLAFKAAGNDRNDGPDCNAGGSRCDGPYDSITCKGVAKNVITIGALTDSDEMTEFSGWGPADDGRIKPDLCANGYGLRSTYPDNKYNSISGTSMATPSASGGAALLYQHFHNIIGQYPTATTLKALLIHSAKDLGRTGPDYETGWGLMNVEKCANLIIQRSWDNGVINETGSDQTYNIMVPQNIDELKVTLVWTDQPGSPSAAKALVNDLDLLITDPDGNQYLPWILDKNNPESMALYGKNHVDNVEQVVVNKPSKGNWTVQISGFVVPFGPQDFTVVAKGINANSKTFVIYNEGANVLNITDIEKEHNSAWLISSPAPPFSIEPNNQQIVTVTVKSEFADSASNAERLLIYSNDPDNRLFSEGVYIILGQQDNNALLTDAITMLKIMAGMNSSIIHNGTNNDNRISLKNVVYLFQKLAGLKL